MKTISPDKIVIRDLTLMVNVGCTAEERSYPQRLTLDVEVELNTELAAKTGRLSETVCYMELSNSLRDLVKKQNWALIEQLAHDVCHLLFEKFPPVQQIRLNVKKYVLPEASWVGLELIRKRDE